MKNRYTPIIPFFIFWLPAICLAFLNSCAKKEIVETVDYSPVQLQTSAFSNLEDNKVTLTGKISRLNGMPVEDHGFIIQKIENYNSDEKEIMVSLGSKAAVGDVTLQYEHSNKFELGDRFRYTLYVKTTNGFYRGESNVFEVDGIQIDLLETQLVPNNNELKITGDFRFLSDNIKLYYESQYQEATLLAYEVASDQKSLTFTFPKSDNFYHGNNVSVFLQLTDDSGYFGRRAIANILTLGTLNPPTKTKIYLNEGIQLTGPALRWDRMSHSPQFFLLINGKKIPYSSQIMLQNIEGLTGDKFQVGYHNGQDSVVFKDSIALIKPIGSDLLFTKKVIHSPALLNVDGINTYTYIMDPEKAKYYLGNHAIAHQFNSSYGSSQDFAVRNVPDGLYNFSYSSPFYAAKSTTQVEVRNLSWNTPTTTTRFAGESFTITGNFIDGQAYSVIGNGIGEYPVAQDGKITFTLPSYVIGATEIQIGYRVNIGYNEEYYAPKKQRLVVNDFQVNSITPLEGYPGDVVTIKGKGLSFVQIMIGGIYVNGFSRTTDEVRFVIPALAPKGPNSIIMTFNGTTKTYKEKFEVL